MKKYFVTGLILLIPVALTGIIILSLFNFFTAPLAHVLHHSISAFEGRLPITISPSTSVFISQIITLILLISFIFFLGVIARWFVVKHFISGAHWIVRKIPFVKSIYKISYEIISALFSEKSKNGFKDPVLIPFPEAPLFTIGFHSGEVPQECQQKVATPLMSVFTPASPHPMSGFLFLVPKEEAQTLDMSKEDAVKFIISCGLVNSNGSHTRKEHDRF